jgi:GTP cyclohydrolase I
MDDAHRPDRPVTSEHLQSEEHRRELEIAAQLFQDEGPVKPEIREAVQQLLVAFGEDVDRQGLDRTPERVARMYDELLAGYRIDPHAMINDALFEVDYEDMVVVKDIEFYSLCEHHLLPFLGRAHLAYLPAGRVLGLSKVPRIVDLFARRLQVQERLTRQIADFMEAAVHPMGVGVIVEGIHLCAMMRGVKKANARMVTSALCGTFRSNPVTRQEFLAHIGRSVQPFEL